MVGLISVKVSITSCGGEDCTPLQSELSEAKAEVANRDSLLEAIGSTFSMIDSNMVSMESIEGELMEQMKSPDRNGDAIKENVDKKKINCYVEEIKTSIETLVEFIKEREIT